MSTSTFGRYVAETWRMRRYAAYAARSAVLGSNANTRLGQLWLLLEPAISISTYWMIFGLLLDVSRGVDNFLAFLTVGHITFGLTQRALLQTGSSLSANTPMLRSLAFPRAVLPMSSTFRSALIARSDLAVMVTFLVLMTEWPRLSWLLAPFLIVVQVTTAFGLGLILARAANRIPDLNRAITHVLRLVFFASGVFFPLQQFTDSDVVLRAMAVANPFYGHVALARWLLLGIEPAHGAVVAISTVAWTLGSLGVGAVVFWRGEHTYSAVEIVRSNG